ANRHFRTSAGHACAPRIDHPETFQRRTSRAVAAHDDDDASGCAAESRSGYHVARGNPASVFGRSARMNAFRFQAMELDGRSVDGVIEAEDRKSALRLLGERGLYPSNLELANGDPSAPAVKKISLPRPEFNFGKGISRKQITAFTRGMSALLGAAIPIPQAL